jgi:copper chaperone
MVCSGCVDTVTKAVQSVDPSASVQVSLESKVVSVETQASVDALKEAIVASGHTVA